MEYQKTKIDYLIIRAMSQILGEEITEDMAKKIIEKCKIRLKGNQIQEIRYKQGLLIYRFIPYKANKWLNDGLACEISKKINQNPTAIVIDEDGYYDSTETERYNIHLAWGKVCEGMQRDKIMPIDEIVPW